MEGEMALRNKHGYGFEEDFIACKVWVFFAQSQKNGAYL